MEKLDFSQIPDEIELPIEEKVIGSVAQEIEAAKELIRQRILKCKKIKPIYKRQPKKPLHYSVKFVCVCPRYMPTYRCQHAGNVLVDRDVLTKEAHIRLLATPKKDYAAVRKRPRFFPKKFVLSDCTARIEQLSKPDPNRMKETLRKYRNVLPKKLNKSLQARLNKINDDVPFMAMKKALDYIAEEQRLRRVKRKAEKKRCKQMKKCILRKQRRQIRRIICVLFEEMKDFLLNDQFIIDEQSTLCAVILEQLKEFTEKEFYSTSNLCDYQKILANNLTVWINKFISSLNIHIKPPITSKPCPQPDDLNTFLPVQDYISASDSEEGYCFGGEIEGEEMLDEEDYEVYDDIIGDIIGEENPTNL